MRRYGDSIDSGCMVNILLSIRGGGQPKAYIFVFFYAPEALME
jgi:hypothetical protein